MDAPERPQEATSDARALRLVADARALALIEQRLERDAETLQGLLMARLGMGADVGDLHRRLIYVRQLQAVLLAARGQTTCNWCPDRLHPSPEHHDPLDPMYHLPYREPR